MYTFMLCSVLFSIIDILFIALRQETQSYYFSLFIFILITSHDQMYYFYYTEGETAIKPSYHTESVSVMTDVLVVVWNLNWTLILISSIKQGQIRRKICP